MVDTDKDWVKLHRNLLTNDLWRSEPFSKGQAWVDLLLLANFTDGFFFNRGIKVEVKRGQVGMSELQLSIRWRWSRTKVKSFFCLLEKEQQIIQHRNNINSLITIVNYDAYQSKKQQKEHDECSRSAAEVQQESTNKKEKKENKEEPMSDFEKERLSFFEDLWKVYPRKIGKPDALKHYLKTVKTDADIDRINLALAFYLDEVKGTEMRFIKHGSAWFHQWQNWVPADAE